MKAKFPLKYFLGDNQNAIKIQIWVSMIAWLLMQVIKKQVKRKWSLSNLMTAVHIQINSYIGLYDFLNVPEAQWVRVVERRRKIPNESWANTLFGDMRESNLENQKSIIHLQQVTEGGIVNLKFYRTAIIINNGLFSPFTGRVSVGLVFQCQFIHFLLVDHFYYLSKDWKSRISCTFAHELSLIHI